MNHHKKIKALLCVLIVLIICAGGVSYALMDAYSSIKANPMSAFVAAEPPKVEQDGAVPEKKQPTEMIDINGQTYGKNPDTISILMLGIDWDGSEEKDKTGARSDMVMLCTIDVQNSNISFLSIPRDTRTKVHYCDKKTFEPIDKTCVTKINHAYVLGGGNDPKKHGADNAMLATKELIECEGQLNIPVDYYVSIDLEHLSGLADALGGVEVTLEQDYPDIGSKGDVVNLQGNDVRLYLQNRKQMTGGEMDRQRHEQTFMMAIAKKVKDLGAVQAATKLFPQLSGNVIQTNLSIEQIVAMAGVLDKVGSIDNIKLDRFEENWQKFPDPIVKDPPKLDYFIIDKDELLNKMLNLYYTQM
ncbi:MAG: LCP family protein [Christensenella sp.]